MTRTRDPRPSRRTSRGGLSVGRVCRCRVHDVGASDFEEEQRSRDIVRHDDHERREVLEREREAGAQVAEHTGAVQLEAFWDDD